MRIIVLLLVGLLSRQYLSAQKMPFYNLNVDKGLIQSQVLCITQDSQRYLWVGTYAGLDRFDGSTFTHFTRTEGLNASSITCLYTAKDGKIWAGTFRGMSSHDGHMIRNYPVEGGSGSFNFISITEDGSGTIWVLDRNNELYTFQNDRFISGPLPFGGEGGVAGKNGRVETTCIYGDDRGRLLVSFLHKGIYVFENKGWHLFSPTIRGVSGIVGDGTNYFVSMGGDSLLKVSTGGSIIARQATSGNIVSSCVNDGALWVALNKGIQVFNTSDLSLKSAYSPASGLSDNLITSIFKDSEKNIWIGTDGDGLYRFSGEIFSRYDKTNGLTGNTVMGIVRQKNGSLYLGTREGGLSLFDSRKNNFKPIDYSVFSKAGINCMGPGIDHHIFLGTMDGKLLQFDGAAFHEIKLEKKNTTLVNTIASDKDLSWATTSTGCFRLDQRSVMKIKGLEEITIGVLPMGDHTAYIGSTHGIYLADSSGSASKVAVPSLQNIEVFCLQRYGDLIVIGTAANGLYFWNKRTNALYNCTTRNGLSDNQVASLFTDSKGITWVGTGTGVQEIAFDEKNGSFFVKKISKATGYEHSENNLNAIGEDGNGRLWIGTIKGAYVFAAGEPVKNEAHPYIVISRAEFGEGKKNAISFTVKGIFLQDPESVRYAYQLAGYDTGFSAPVSQSFFNYQNLAPGNYTFRVKALAPNGLASVNEAAYSFIVDRPFYKTNWFMISVIILLIFTGISVQYLYSKARQRRQRRLALLLQEDQERIRQRTAEDFHDELGNKLTRISLLADILQKKIGQEDVEKSHIIRQVRENVTALYAGTKDIVWSLSPGSDRLDEVLERIQQFGEELFMDSDIGFVFSRSVPPGIILPVDYSRNMIMIFKELLNNSLRHSQGSFVEVRAGYTKNNELVLSLEDNGKGFDPMHLQKSNGLTNIQRRADRISARLEIKAMENNGVFITLRLKTPLPV